MQFASAEPLEDPVMPTSQIRIIAFREGDQWVAQCLEHDVCVQANDLKTLHARMDVALIVEDIGELPPAPERFFQLLEKRSEFDQTGSTDGARHNRMFAYLNAHLSTH
jgi:hypothetical protein